jgi:serine protease AprX
MVFKNPLLILFSLVALTCLAEDSTSYYFIYLKDKPVSGYSLERPLEFLSRQAIDRRMKRKSTINESDLPVSKDYIKRLAGIEGVKVINSSRWMNAVEVSMADPAMINTVRTMDFVSSVAFLGRIRNRTKPAIEPASADEATKGQELAKEKKQFKGPLTDADYGKTLGQNSLIGINGLHADNLGNNVHIAVFDAGFFNAYKVKGMEDLLSPDMVIRDFVDYDNSVWEDDRHGANVLSIMKTWNPGTFIGSAPMARYSLMRTENPTSEYPTEEVNWLFAAEFADSLGVDMIVSSLGYHTFDDVTLSYKHKDLDGQTSIIAKAANLAYGKGIFIVTSAGNEGLNKWHKIGTPSDAPGVTGIGATDEQGFHASFSSVGPSADKRVKPDFVAMGYKTFVASPNGAYAGNGTSYATPVFGGAMACLLHAFPEASFEDLKQALMLSGTHYKHTDSAYGYGVPDFHLAFLILQNNRADNLQKDLFYIREHPVFFQDLGIHFKSGGAQTVKITVQGKRKKKEKNLYNKNYRLKDGEWLHDDALFSVYAKEKRKKRKQKLREIVLVFETDSATFRKTITLNYH